MLGRDKGRCHKRILVRNGGALIGGALIATRAAANGLIGKESRKFRGCMTIKVIKDDKRKSIWAYHVASKAQLHFNS